MGKLPYRPSHRWPHSPPPHRVGRACSRPVDGGRRVALPQVHCSRHEHAARSAAAGGSQAAGARGRPARGDKCASVLPDPRRDRVAAPQVSDAAAGRARRPSGRVPRRGVAHAVWGERFHAGRRAGPILAPGPRWGDGRRGRGRARHPDREGRHTVRSRARVGPMEQYLPIYLRFAARAAPGSRVWAPSSCRPCAASSRPWHGTFPALATARV